ncbi:MAG: glycosyltransferase [Bacteroidales bacterium]
MPVSIVICARNEEENLSNFLPHVLEQDYPDYEVVVVNDCSHDDTDMVLKRFLQKYKHLKVTTIKKDDKFIHGKKLALTIGIKAAKYDWLLLTDADCKPQGSEWLASMAQEFHSPNEVVLGYGGYIQENGFLNKLIRFDAFFIAVQYLSFALIGKPYMGVGRNLAYKKELFFKNKGFASHASLTSGDDDLFIHQVAKKSNTSVIYNKEAQTRSKAQRTFSGWLMQKKRHLTTSPHYKKGVKFLLGLEPLSRIIFWISGIILIGIQFYPYIIGGLILFRLIIMSVILKIAMNRLNERKIFLLSLLYDLFSPIFYSMLMVANRFKKTKKRWI